MKFLAIILISTSFYSCTQSSSSKDQQITRTMENKELKETANNFEVEKTKTASCDNEIDLKKKLEQEIRKSKMHKKPKALKLQGKNTGCSNN